MTEPKNCWKCGGEVSVESSREMQITQISCDDCDFMKQYRVPEETAIKKWNRKAKEHSK